MTHSLQTYIVELSDIIWTYILTLILIVCALHFTLRTRFVQLSQLREMLRLLLSPDPSHTDSKKPHITSFQAFVIALASRIGTGNLAGVATAISIGGPGAIFWMWVLALLSSATAFVESTLAQLYKRKAHDHTYYGGPAYYMLHGLGKKWMGILFAVLMIVTFGFAYNSVQSNTISAACQKAFDTPPLYMGIITTILTLSIIFGGIHRVAKFSSTIVPLMAVVYLALTFGIIILNIPQLPHVIGTIVSNAFGIGQAAGGALGVTIMQGIKRGLFSNEAGEGSAPNAAATASVSHPVKQGLIQALGVFTDTLVICSCTAFIILLSDTDPQASEGIQLTQAALSTHVGTIGSPLIAILIWLFAFSSIIGNYYYGETNIRYITQAKWPLTLYRLAVGATVMAGAIMTLDLAWSLADIAMAMLTLCNLVAITLLSRQAIYLLQDYVRQKKAGQDPSFTKSQMPDIADKLDAWE